MRALAERNVAQTRELYERSTNALHAVLETWERSLDAAGQGVVALNRKIIDITERNISTGFELATSLAGAKNLVEVMEVQRAYLRKQFGDLKMQAEEVARAINEGNGGHCGADQGAGGATLISPDDESNKRGIKT